MLPRWEEEWLLQAPAEMGRLCAAGTSSVVAAGGGVAPRGGEATGTPPCTASSMRPHALCCGA